MIKKHITILLMLITAAVISSCTTLKQQQQQREDIVIDIVHIEQAQDNLAELVEMIVPLEALGGTEARRRQDELSQARRMISELEKKPSADINYSGELMAWSGRLAILEGRYSEAQRLYRQSQAASPQNIPSVILGIRLEGDPEKRLELVNNELVKTGNQASGFGELQIERGRSLAELNRFAEAAGAFDTAFTSGIVSIYQKSYETGRNRAWELRNSTDAAAGTMGLLVQEGVSWKDCISIVNNETQLLRFISGGRDITDAEFFNRLLDRAFIPYTQNINENEWPAAKPRADEIVTRSGAAWFAWHLYAESRANRGLLSRYSARYTTMTNPRSPIADVPLLSPFFDSILGCVETELMSLPDGRNFNPAPPIHGAELLAIFRRIAN
ncbi:MAG: hypothetical protein FWC03_02875 [Treponema sp.]|nr:hypothetical protein [Treponema sp.]